MAFGPKALPTMRKAMVAGQPPQAPLPLKTCSISGNFLILVASVSCHSFHGLCFLFVHHGANLFGHEAAGQINAADAHYPVFNRDVITSAKEHAFKL